MSTFAEKIRRGDFVVTAELPLPKGIDLSGVFATAQALNGWVDAVNLTESPRALMTIAPTAVAQIGRAHV